MLCVHTVSNAALIDATYPHVAAQFLLYMAVMTFRPKATLETAYVPTMINEVQGIFQLCCRNSILLSG